jgi:hypothetical protein
MWQLPLRAFRAHEDETGHECCDDADAGNDHHGALLEITAFQGFRCAV